MAKKKNNRNAVNLDKLLVMRQNGVSVKDCAEHFGVSLTAIYKHFRAQTRLNNRHIALEAAPELVSSSFAVREQLEKINERANELLDLLDGWLKGDVDALELLESQIIEKQVKVAGKLLTIKEFKMKDPRELMIKVMAEIRHQVALQHQIHKDMYDVKEIENFQNVVLDCIREIEPNVAERIIAKLRRESAVRRSYELPG